MKNRNARQSHEATYFVEGEWNVYDDLTGRKWKSSQVMTRWDNAIMPAHLFEERHPQDFLRGKKEVIGAPWARPEQEDKFGQTGPDDL